VLARSVRCNFRTKRDSTNLNLNNIHSTLASHQSAMFLIIIHAFKFFAISSNTRDGRRPGRAGKDLDPANSIARNGCRYATFWRASASQNVAEAERANASAARPKGARIPTAGRPPRVTGLLGAGLIPGLYKTSSCRTPGGRGAKIPLIIFILFYPY
jgi:hypothetical protein